VLWSGPVKLFIDVDGVPTNKKGLIYELFDDFIDFMKKRFNKTLTRCALTMNKHSISHPGLSYHVYFPEYHVNNIYQIKYILTLFIKDYSKYYDYVDGCIYHYNRLFRCVNQYNASTKSRGEKDDIHLLIAGSIDDTIIQIPSGELLNVDIDVSEIKGTVLKNESFDYEKINLKKLVKAQRTRISEQQKILSHFTSNNNVDNKSIPELRDLLNRTLHNLKIPNIDNIHDDHVKSFTLRALTVQKLLNELQRDLNIERIKNGSK
jgi:hypothetical protein